MIDLIYFSCKACKFQGTFPKFVPTAFGSARQDSSLCLVISCSGYVVTAYIVIGLAGESYLQTLFDLKAVKNSLEVTSVRQHNC